MAEKKEEVYKRLEDYEEGKLEQKLREIRAKQLSNKSLTPEENLLWTEYNERVTAFEEQQKLEQEKLEQEKKGEKQEELLKEFDATPDEDKVSADTEGAYLSHGPNPIKLFLAKRAMNKVGKKAKKKGGVIIEKVYLDSSIELIWVGKPKNFVEFVRTDEKGIKVRSIARVTKTKHRLKGSSVPIHVAIEGVSENANLLEGVNTSLSAQHINQSNMLFFQAGFFDALDAKEQQGKKLDMASAGVILMFVVLIVMAYIAYQQYTLYELVTVALGGA